MQTDIIRPAKSLYAAFDQFPSSKGAATHILHFSQTLFELFNGGLLYTAGSIDLPSYQDNDSVQIFRSHYGEKNFLLRALSHCRQLECLYPNIGSSCRMVHFRDPWSGAALCSKADSGVPRIYEVNAFPSIELQEFFPHILPATIKRIYEIEQFCLDNADTIITPSNVTANCIVNRGVDRSKIQIIPNGADIIEESSPPEDISGEYIVYFGALQKWQGVDVLINAFSRLADFPTVKLVICSSVAEKKSREFISYAKKLGCAEKIIWKYELNKTQLYQIVSHALFSVAPLRSTPRNVLQGCCPLKILESMAAGTPVVASDLSVVDELFSDGVHGMKVRPDRPDALSLAMRVLLEYPTLTNEMRSRCKMYINEKFSWEHICAMLRNVYRDVLEKKTLQVGCNV